MATVVTVENAVHAKREIELLETQGFNRDNIYVFAHGKDREKDVADALDAEIVSTGDKGIFKSMKHVASKRGDELREEMQSVGLSKEEADQYEEVLDTGKLVLVAKK